MAKMWPVRGLDSSAEFAFNARLVLATRIDELYSHTRVLDHPEDSVGLHDLRISIKRLRYSLEFFAVCFDAGSVEWLLESLSSMQELLGNLHDADELVPHLHKVLGEVEEHRVLETEALLGAGTHVAEAEEAPSSRYVPGLLAAIWRMREQREQSYLCARELWEKLGAQGFRACLDRLAGRGGSFGETW